MHTEPVKVVSMSDDQITLFRWHSLAGFESSLGGRMPV